MKATRGASRLHLLTSKLKRSTQCDLLVKVEDWEKYGHCVSVELCCPTLKKNKEEEKEKEKPS